MGGIDIRAKPQLNGMIEFEFDIRSPEGRASIFVEVENSQDGLQNKQAALRDLEAFLSEALRLARQDLD